MTYHFEAASHCGLVRTNNEDAVLFDVALQVASLADGMGGYKAGEVASRMATELVLQHFGQWLATAGPAPQLAQLQPALEAALEAANRAIYQAAQADADCAGMGTTLVMAVFQPTRVVLAHLGDSRCYRLRQHMLEPLTRDHSLLQEQLDAGLLTPQQAAASASRNLVTRALGIEDMVVPEIHEFPAQDGDLYLLCSDGLNDMLGDDEIAAVLDSTKTLADKAAALVALANAHGGRDNVSVLLAQENPPLHHRPLISRWLGF